VLKSNLDLRNLSELDRKGKLLDKINAISNFILTKNRRRPANFIIGSRKSIDLIVESLGTCNHAESNTYIYDNRYKELDQSLIVSSFLDDDTIIIGAKPKDEEVGIKLVVNEKTLNNYVFSDDDIKGINLHMNFFDFGKNPEYNYFILNLIS